MPLVHAGENGLQFLHVSSSALPESDRIAFFREVFGRTILKIEMNPFEEQPLEVDMRLFGLDGVGVAAGRLSPMCNRHLAGLADNDDLVLVALRSGKGSVAQVGRHAEVSGGEAVLTVNGEPGTFTGSTVTELINFRFDRRRLTERLDDAGAALVQPIRGDNPALRLLTGYADIVNDNEALASPTLRRLAVEHLYDLAALALGTNRDDRELAQRRGVRAARLRAIKEDIRRSLGAHELGVALIARRHGVSPRYVQMLFEADGTTFSEFVLAERLANAWRMLVDMRFDQLKVSEIAYAAGFSDLSHFNRTFRRRYGDTPRGVRARAASAEPR